MKLEQTVTLEINFEFRVPITGFSKLQLVRPCCAEHELLKAMDFKDRKQFGVALVSVKPGQSDHRKSPVADLNFE